MSVRTTILGVTFAGIVVAWSVALYGPANEADPGPRPPPARTSPDPLLLRPPTATGALPEASVAANAPPPVSPPARAVETSVLAIEEKVEERNSPRPPPLDSHARAEEQVRSATQHLAIQKAQLRVDANEPDEGRTSDVRDQYQTQFEDLGIDLDPDVKCASGVCRIRVAISDPGELAQLDEMHRELGVTPMSVYEGDPARGIVTGVDFYLFEAAVLQDLVGNDTQGIFSPGPGPSMAGDPAAPEDVTKSSEVGKLLGAMNDSPGTGPD